ncbi:hypothetical protein IWQ60_006865 [Tieghemiomyces parasiticus]|uniref:Uncharacterized protein n=1 Tax=Tieghemiomyces parasiticus TaxID=78921 RepID=A0A9W8AAT0_9FUNG|nr:hypothetical protein IWQ60_006865 [Tieghemiomyces parasiticus]
MEIARQQQYDRYAKTAGQPGSDVDKKDLKQMDKFIKPNFIRTARLAYTQELNHKIPDPNKRSTLQKLLAYSDKKMNAINKVTANTRELEPSKHNPAHWALRSVTGLSNKYATFRSRHRSA